MTGTRRTMPAWGPAVGLAGLTLVALALRIPSFTDSLWGDELSTNYVIHGFGNGNVLDIVSSDQEGTPPLFFLLTWLTAWVGDAEGLRVISMLAGLAAIPLVYLLGLRTVGAAGAAVAAALLALSPFQIFYSTEARSYELTMFFCVAAALVLLVAIESGRTRWWAAFAVAAAGAALSHYSAIFVLIVLFAWAFCAHPTARKPLLLATGGAALLFAPWIPQFLADGDTPAAAVIQLIHPLSVSTALSDMRSITIGHPLIAWDVVPGKLAAWAAAAGVAIGAAGAALRLRGETAWRPSRELILVAALAFAAPVGAVIQDAFGPAVFLPRNLITSVPGLALLAGGLVAAGRPPLRWIAVGLLLGGFTIGAVKMLDEDNHRPDYDAAAEFIESHGEPGSPVVDVPQTTPGPQTGLQAAMAPKGKPLPEDRTMYSLYFPSYDTLIEAARGPLSIEELLGLPYPSSEELARQSAREAGDGTLFLVTSGGLPIEQLQSIPGPIQQYLDALPPRFHEVDSAVFPGLGVNSIKVDVLSGMPE